ncbi:MAG: NAD-binding protein, partial [Clostridiales bacterium]|nr:NAD-binding protein [Clostridiales bacterium]
MKSIIIGGGKIGYNLLKTLKERGYEVTLIEKDEGICKKIAEDIDADIICGDGTDPDVLNDADIKRAGIIAAVTGKDEENLVACQIARKGFNICKSIARINNPKNIEMFKALGVDKTVCSTDVIANLIEFEFDREICKIVQAFDRGAMVLVEADVKEGSRWDGSYIKEISLPSECVVASILRNGKAIFPRGDTRIHSG